MPLRNLLVILLATVISLACYEQAQRNRYAAVVGEAMLLIDEHYLENVDRRKLFEDAMAGMVGNLDPYSGYIAPEPLQEMQVALDQEFGGVGIEVEKPDKNGPILVLSPIVGTPAYRAGIYAGDAILAVDGVSTLGMDIKDALQKMRGKPGSAVRLRWLHPGKTDPIDMTLIREVVTVDSVLGDVRRGDGSWDFHLAENGRIGYLRIITFGQHTAEELRRVLTEARGNPQPFEALILDVRGNAGGLLDAAVEVCDLFLDDGVIVSTCGKDGEIRSSYSASRSNTVVPAGIPIAVLVNKYSASASEILAACLQDYRRAVVVGSRTWGKGTVQNIFDLEGGRSALKLTTAGYRRPSGKNIHRRKDAGDNEDWGVLPDKGFEVLLSDEETERLFRQRRLRDVVSAAGTPGETGDSSTAGAVTGTGENKAEQTEPPIDDRQLRRAIEYVEERLSGVSSPALPAAGGGRPGAEVRLPGRTTP